MDGSVDGLDAYITVLLLSGQAGNDECAPKVLVSSSSLHNRIPFTNIFLSGVSMCRSVSRLYAGWTEDSPETDSWEKGLHVTS